MSDLMKKITNAIEIEKAVHTQGYYPKIEELELVKNLVLGYTIYRGKFEGKNINIFIDRVDNLYYYDDGEGKTYNFTNIVIKSDELSALDYNIKSRTGLSRLPERFFIDSDYNFSQIIYYYYKNRFKCCSKTEVWYECVNGLWKNTESKKNFTLIKEIAENLSQVFEIHETCFRSEIKTVLEIVSNFGFVLHKGKLCQEINGKLKPVENSRISSFSEDIRLKIKEAEGIHEKIEVCKNLKQKCSETIKFVPQIINASICHFKEDNLMKQFDNNRNHFCFKNGYVCLDTFLIERQFHFLPHRPSNYNMISTGYELKRFSDDINYAADYLTENIKRCFDTEEKFINMMESKAYCLMGNNPEKIMFMNLGERGNNGKGLTMDLMKNCFGDYFGSCDPSIFYVVKGDIDKEKPSPALHKVVKSRYLALSEPEEGRKMSDAMAKKIIGGDPIQHRDLHKSIEESVVHFKIHLDSNFFIEQSISSSWKSKVKLISWDVEFKKGVEEETEILKRSSDIKERINVDIDKVYNSAWFYMLLDKFSKEFEIIEAFKLRQNNEEEDINYVKEFFEDYIEEVEDNVTDALGNKYLITPVDVHKKFRIVSKKILEKKKFLKEFEEYLKPEKIIRTDGNRVRINGKQYRDHYLNYKFREMEN